MKKWKKALVADPAGTVKRLEDKALMSIGIVRALKDSLGEPYEDDEIEELALEMMSVDDDVVDRNYAYVQVHGTVSHSLIAEVGDSLRGRDAVVTEAMRSAIAGVQGTGTEAQCPGCLGKGRYVGATTIEDPCGQCGGSGRVRT